jgi:hypothetical protein
MPLYHGRSALYRNQQEIRWDAGFEKLINPPKLKGRELLMRTGWWTIDPKDVAEVVKKHGRLVVGDAGELMVEFPDQEAAETLSKALSERFGNQVLISP